MIFKYAFENKVFCGLMIKKFIFNVTFKFQIIRNDLKLDSSSSKFFPKKAILKLGDFTIFRGV